MPRLAPAELYAVAWQHTKDIDESNAPVPSILLTPEWVTAQTVESTIVKDNFVPASQICASSSPASGQPTYAADCTKYGIS